MKQIAVEKILPRTPIRLKNIEKDYTDDFFDIPLKLVYAKDLEKYIIIDGHHRYYKAKEKGIKHLKFKKIAEQETTEFSSEGLPKIKWDELIK